MLIGLANDEIGYIIPKRQWDVKKPFCYGRKKRSTASRTASAPRRRRFSAKHFANSRAGIELM